MFICRCSIRNKETNCNASVTQKGDSYQRGPSGHKHGVRAGEEAVVRIIKTLKDNAAANLFKPSGILVNEAIRQEGGTGPLASLPSKSAMARCANRLRQKSRPADPTDLEFDLDRSFIPGGKFIVKYAPVGRASDV